MNLEKEELYHSMISKQKFQWNNYLPLQESMIGTTPNSDLTPVLPESKTITLQIWIHLLPVLCMQMTDHNFDYC